MLALKEEESRQQEQRRKKVGSKVGVRESRGHGDREVGGAIPY